MRVHPRLGTERLRLRPFLADDAERLAELAGDARVADTALALPHPLSVSMARSLIAGNAAGFQAERSVHFAVELRATPELIGSVELRDRDREHRRAELAFWIGAAWWGRGLASEAAGEVLRHGFAEMALHRIHARHLLRSPASGAVLRKLGMKQEGLLREDFRKGEAWEDVALYASLRADQAPVAPV